MTLRDLMQRHARTVMTSPDHHGETARLFPQAGGASRTVRCVIARKGRVASSDESAGFLAEVWIPRDASTGITAFTAGDQLEFAMVVGGAVARHSMFDLIRHDDAGFLINVWA